MSWEELSPIVKTTPRCKALINIIKGDIAQLKLSFSETFFVELGEPKTLDAFAGTGDNLGRVMLKKNPKGKFELRGYDKGGAGIVMPLPAGIERLERESTPCEVETALPDGSKLMPDQVIIVLPVKIWDELDGKVARQAARNSASAAPVLKVAGAAIPKTAKLDVVNYFRTKNQTCERLQGDAFRLNGERETRKGMMVIINNHRRRADLEPIGEFDFE